MQIVGEVTFAGATCCRSCILLTLVTGMIIPSRCYGRCKFVYMGSKSCIFYVVYYTGMGVYMYIYVCVCVCVTVFVSAAGV